MKHLLFTLLLVSFFGSGYCQQLQTPNKGTGSKSYNACKKNAAGLRIVVNATNYEADGMTDRNGGVVFSGVPAGEILITNIGKDKEIPSCEYKIMFKTAKTKKKLWEGTFEDIMSGINITLPVNGDIILSLKQPKHK